MADDRLARRTLLRVLGAGTVAGSLTAGTAAAVHQTWRARLSPMVDESRGHGNFEAKRAGNRLTFGLEAATLTSRVKMAHIHHTADGAPVVWLFSEIPETPSNADDVIQRGDGNAFAAEGSFTADDLVGHLEGGSLDDLVAAIEDGNTFVRVHTADHLPGEIEGPVR